MKLDAPISRTLSACLVDLLKINQRALISGVLSPLFCDPLLTSFQSDAIKKLITNEGINADGISLLLSKCFENKNSMVMTDDIISLLEIMLNIQPNLTESCLSCMLHIFESNSSSLTKSLKLMKVVVTLVKTYPLKLAKEKVLLLKIVNENSTFMRKTALSLI